MNTRISNPFVLLVYTDVCQGRPHSSAKASHAHLLDCDMLTLTLMLVLASLVRTGHKHTEGGNNQ